MKKYLLPILVLFAALLCLAASAPSDQRTVLSTSTLNGVTKTLYIGRVQTDPAKDGTATLQVYVDTVATDSAGNVISSTGAAGQSFTVTLTPQQYAAVAGIISAAYNAQNP